MIAICCQLIIRPRKLTSMAVPDRPSISSSPSFWTPMTTSSGAPWNMGQGVSSTVARCRLRSDHPRRTRIARISHSAARDSDSVEMESWLLSEVNWTLLRSRQKTDSLATLGWRQGACSARGNARKARGRKHPAPPRSHPTGPTEQRPRVGPLLPGGAVQGNRRTHQRKGSDAGGTSR